MGQDELDKAMVLSDMTCQPGAAELCGFPLPHHHLLNLFRRLARRGPGLSGELFQTESTPISLHELPQRVSGPVKGVGYRKHAPLSLSESSKGDPRAVHRVRAVDLLIGELNHDPRSSISLQRWPGLVGFREIPRYFC